LNYIMRGARFGRMPEKWFTPLTQRDFKPALKYRLATTAIVLAGRFGATPIPWPEPVPFDQAATVAGWALDAVRREGACLIFCLVSSALRICVAAQAMGRDLNGVTFEVGGEPPTKAKVNTITGTGAKCYPTYHFGECGRVGMGCARPVDCNDVHFFKDGLAMIQQPRQVPGFDMTVNAFCFTTLLPTAPKLMLNVEIDDYGVVETRACGCPLENYGYAEHIREIRSFRKLTGEGVTLVGGEMLTVMEELLPARFGGTPLDYQLVEEEDEKGFTKLSLMISPRLSLPDEQTVIDTVLDALAQRSVANSLTRAIWHRAGTLRIKRMEPIRTARGKLLPLHLLPAAGHSKDKASTA